MRYYIISKKTCNVKVNGCFLGKADCTPSFFNAEEGALLELYPLDNAFSPITATLFSNCNNYNGITAYEYNGGYILLPFFELKANYTYKLLFNEEFEFGNVCVFLDGQIKLFINAKEGSNLFYLPFLPSKITAKQKKNILFLTLTNRTQKECMIFNLNKVPTLILTNPIQEATFNDASFTLVRKVNFLRSSFIKCEYDYNGIILNKNFIKSRAISALSPLLTPFAFLEELLEKLPIEEFLDSSLQPHKQMIFEFFGNFSTFIPLIKNERPGAILLYKKRAKEICFMQNNGLISDFYFI